ncbi:MAG: glycosyltransferase family 87 protein [Chthoniobacteraceae bacterium]
MKSEINSTSVLPNSLRRLISPQTFYRFALIFSGAILIFVYPLLNIFAWNSLPSSMRIDGSDFGQYYAGGLVARHGIWRDLYPIQKKEIFDQAPQFKPLIKTRFFVEGKNQRFLYPHIASPSATDISEELATLCPQLCFVWRYMYPPPLALYLKPLGYFDYMTAGKIWFTGMSLSFFGIGLLASMICRHLFGRTTYVQGWVTLLPLLPIFLGSNTSTTLSVGNSSPFLGFLIALVAYAWIKGWQAVMAAALIVLIPFKGIGASWYPLFLVKPVKWVTFLVSAGLAVLVNGVTVAYAGVSIYREFFKAVLPWANSPEGTGLQGILKDAFGISLQSFISIAVFLLYAVIYIRYWRNRKQSNPVVIVASVVGMVAIFCTFNPVVWPNYCTIYLFLPFAGWLFWELDKARGAWKAIIGFMMALNLFLYLDQVVFYKDSLLISWLTTKGWCSPVILHLRAIGVGANIYAIPLLEAFFFMVLAFRRLFIVSENQRQGTVLSPRRDMAGHE